MSLEDRVLPDHPPWVILRVVNDALSGLSGELETLFRNPSAAWKHRESDGNVAWVNWRGSMLYRRRIHRRFLDPRADRLPGRNDLDEPRSGLGRAL